MDLKEAYSVLDVPDGASFAAAQASYRKLVRVWHPDRFASSPELKPLAEEKLKALNSAIEVVRENDARKSPSESDGAKSAVLFRDLAGYLGGDPRLREPDLDEAIHGGRDCIVEVKTDTVTILTFIGDEPDQLVIYAGVDLTYCRLDRKFPEHPCRIRLGAADPSNTSEERSACIQFRNEYQAKQFYRTIVSIAPARKTQSKQAQSPPKSNPTTSKPPEPETKRAGSNDHSEDRRRDAPPDNSTERDPRNSPEPEQVKSASDSNVLSPSEKKSLTTAAAIFAVGACILLMAWATSESSKAPRILEASPVVRTYHSKIPTEEHAVKTDETATSTLTGTGVSTHTPGAFTQNDERTPTDLVALQNRDAARRKTLEEDRRRQERLDAQLRKEIEEEQRRQDLLIEQRRKEDERRRKELLALQRRQEKINQFESLLGQLQNDELDSAAGRLNTLLATNPENDALNLIRSWLIIYACDQESEDQNPVLMSIQSPKSMTDFDGGALSNDCAIG